MSKLRGQRSRSPDRGLVIKDKTMGEMETLKNPRIFQRAIENAKKHKIKLTPGIENNGFGNCSYESAILNINNRDCFREKLCMSPDYYRRVWNTDIMNKILDGTNPWNPGLTRSEIVKGFMS